jgi:hypothetical protein
MVERRGGWGGQLWEKEGILQQVGGYMYLVLSGRMLSVFLCDKITTLNMTVPVSPCRML